MPTVVVNHDLPIAKSLEGCRDDLTVISASDRNEILSLLPDAEVLVCNTGGWDDSFLDALDDGDWN